MKFFIKSILRFGAVTLVLSSIALLPIPGCKESANLDDRQEAVMLDFSEEAAAKLKRFSADNIGGAVAVVIGGKIATRHKIRVAISGGKLQISCCGAGACEHLLSELKDNYSSSQVGDTATSP